MADPLEQLGKLVPKETIGRFYEDALSSPAKEFSKLSTDAVKVVRLLLAPLQVAAAFQDRFERMMERMQKRVPEDDRIEAPPELIGPTLERMRYVDDQSELWTMYEEVLTRAIDRYQSAHIHPSFSWMISQLSRDEAWILYRLRDRSFNVIDTLTLDRAANRFQDRVIEESELPVSELILPEKVELYYSHLESLSLVEWPVLEQTPIFEEGQQTGIRRKSTMRLTEFGGLFVKCCIPKEGFRPLQGVPRGDSL